MAISKIPLSGSSNGDPIKVSLYTIGSTTIHTTGTSASVYDSITIYAYTAASASSAADLRFNLGDGGGSLNDTSFTITIPANTATITKCFEGLVFNGTGSAGTTITAQKMTGSSEVCVVGFVNRIS